MNGTIASGLDEADERALITQSLDTLERVSGKRPRGWLSIARSQSFNTPRLLVEGRERVTITGFGVFEQRRRAARVARNPRTGETVKVTREVDGGLETDNFKLPAIVTTDLRLNEPRYASLPNIMKAKKKPLDETSAETLGVDVAPRLKVLKTVEPAGRSAGVKVANAAELVSKLKTAGVI